MEDKDTLGDREIVEVSVGPLVMLVVVVDGSIKVVTVLLGMIVGFPEGNYKEIVKNSMPEKQN